MRLLNQSFTLLSGVIVLTALTFGVANANNEYAMEQAQQSSTDARASVAMAEAALAKATADEYEARAEALAKVAETAKANAYKARVEAIKKTEAYEKIKAELKKVELNELREQSLLDTH